VLQSHTSIAYQDIVDLLKVEVNVVMVVGVLSSMMLLALLLLPFTCSATYSMYLLLSRVQLVGYPLR
jgi:hypothetical protein